jgi:3D (Asp-Asp-Asp) domain-containing protein
MPSFILTGLLAFFVLTGSAGQASAPAYPTLDVAMTAYNAVPWQTDGDPSITASGAFSNPNVVAARSRDLAEELPFGTVIAIESAREENGCGISVVSETIGYRVIADTMNARIVNTVDILFDTDDTIYHGGKSVNAARVLGYCDDVTIRVVGTIDISNPATMPKTQVALAAAVGASGLALR